LAIVEARETQTGLSEATLLEIRASDFAKTLHDRKFTLYWTGNLCGHGITPMEPRDRTYKKGTRNFLKATSAMGSSDFRISTYTNSIIAQPSEIPIQGNGQKDIQKNTRTT